MSQPGQELSVFGGVLGGCEYLSCSQLGYVSPLLQMKPYVEFNCVLLLNLSSWSLCCLCVAYFGRHDVLCFLLSEQNLQSEISLFNVCEFQ